jgi:hypothetical protein
VSWGAITNVSNRIDDVQADNTPVLFVDANNNAHVVWHDYKRVYYSHTVGGIWRPIYDLYSGNNVGSPQLVAGQTPGQLHCIFACRDPGTWDCFQMYGTIPDATPPQQVDEFSRPHPATGRTSWNGTRRRALDRAGVRIRWKTTGFPVNANDGTLLSDVVDPGFTINHSGIANGTTLLLRGVFLRHGAKFLLGGNGERDAYERAEAKTCSQTGRWRLSAPVWRSGGRPIR